MLNTSFMDMEYVICDWWHVLLVEDTDQSGTDSKVENHALNGSMALMLDQP